MTSLRTLVSALWIGPVLALAACATGGDISKPIPQAFVAAPQTAHRLVVMLPGRGDSLKSLEHNGTASLIQQHWPDADVVLTGLTMPFYRQGQAVQRLHDEVIMPMRRPAYREVWLAGISLGGMGALLYDQQYPDAMNGLLLLSPYLGDDAIHREIRAAGGLAAWQPGPPQAIGPDTFQRELWRSLKGWSQRPQRTGSVWLAYGADEPFRNSIELMTPLLPPDHVIVLPGGHNWALWTSALGALLDRARPAHPTESP